MKLSIVLTILFSSFASCNAVKRMLTVTDYFKHNPEARRKLTGVIPTNQKLTCGTVFEAFATEAWSASSCTCKTHDAYSLTATCIDKFECCSDDGVCVTNSFQQVIDTETFEPLDTMEYFHYTQGRTGTLSLYHVCDTGICTCSLHADTSRCRSCSLIDCDGEEAASFDCSNIEGGGKFNFCPNSSVSTLDTSSIMGVLQDGFIDFQNNCKALPGHVAEAIGGVHDLAPAKARGSAAYSNVGVASFVLTLAASVTGMFLVF